MKGLDSMTSKFSLGSKSVIKICFFYIPESLLGISANLLRNYFKPNYVVMVYILNYINNFNWKVYLEKRMPDSGDTVCL